MYKFYSFLLIVLCVIFLGRRDLYPVWLICLSLAATTFGVMAVLFEKEALRNEKILYVQPISVIVIALAAVAVQLDAFLKEDCLEWMTAITLAIVVPNIYQICLIGKLKEKDSRSHREAEGA